MFLPGFTFLLTLAVCDKPKQQVSGELSLPAQRQAEPLYSESPKLKVFVGKGEIPPVQKRLPVNPVLIKPEEETGDYGGIWRMGLLEPWDPRKIFAFVEYESLVRWNPQWEKIVPNVAQSVQINDSMTVFTFVLRKGMKWSDGTDMTTEDIEYWYDHVLCNQEAASRIPCWLSSDGGPLGFDKLDAQTFRFTFDRPQPFFLEHLAHPHGAEITRYPEHYLIRKESVKPSSQNIKKATESRVIGECRKISPGCACDGCWDFDRPCLNAWVLSEKTDDSIVFERNPYYWKIDLEFKQLPYIDRVEFLLFRSPDAFSKAVKRGEIQYIDSYLSSLQAVSDLSHQNSGQMYYDINLFASESNVMAIAFNQCHPDPKRRALLQNKQFRAALSLAIDREKIVQQLLGGQVRPRQPAPVYESPFYHEKLATQYTAFLPDSSRKLMKSVFSEIRKRGTEISSALTFKMIVIREMSYLYLWQEILRFVRSEWRSLGVDLSVRILDNEEFLQIVRSGDYDLAVTPGYGGMDPIIEPSLYFPFDDRSCFGYSWAMMLRSNNRDHFESEPPIPDIAREQLTLYDKMVHTISAEQRKLLLRRIFDLSAEAFYVIGISEMPDRTAWVRSDSYNVLPVMSYAWSYPTPGPSNPCQYTINIPE